MKSIFFFIFCGLFIGSKIQAQPLAKAPILSKKKVKQIIEWIRLDLDEKAREGAISEFDNKGNLLACYSKKELPVKQLTSKYDVQNRLVEKVELFGNDPMTTYYAYKKGLQIEEIKFRGKTTKTFYYKNQNNQLVEKKVYTKGLELGSEFLLKERIIYHYNKKDSLTGEKIFSYDMLGKGKSKKYDASKILHYYNSKSGKRSKTLIYDFDGSLINEMYYEYDKQNRLTKTISHFKMENTIVSKEIKYKDGKIWQTIIERPGYKDVKIYIDGRLIRLRSYNEEKIIRIVDYQYFYY